MTIHDGIQARAFGRPVVTVGSFDGVHRGHLSVVDALVEAAAKTRGEAVVVTFDPHPREVLFPMERAPGILTTTREKAEILGARGVEHLVVLPFTTELGGLAYAEFVERVLVGTIGMKGLVVGFDHRFGRGREGDFEGLRGLAAASGFFLQRVPALVTGEGRVSSTRIRDALATGDARLVNELLGYRYALTGRVVAGERLGRRIGFPTANLQVEDGRKCLPASGAYAALATVKGVTTGGLLNVGTRPTVSRSGELSIEAHLFDFNADAYGQEMTVRLVDRLRGERRFENVEELARQLARDKEQALERLEGEV
ncbi:MAG: bifunctional riboflavin kinase/FAD synthetase [Odoribacteraceae bacterium]|jgi:riboflavin kinase/FMN adenylyltransferase|nr:bifunctional riboflavin kinase/FAD synthetase [Odoribacteraceae bacterium]